MCGDSCVRGAARQKGIPDCDQLGSMTACAQALQEKQRLVLSSTIVAAEVDDERAHAQASPGFGHGRCVSFSPASTRPSLRYLM